LIGLHGIVTFDERFHVVELADNDLAVVEPDGDRLDVQLGDGAHDDGAVPELDALDGLILARLRHCQRYR